MKKVFILYLLIVFIPILVYFNSLDNGFHHDDYHHIATNLYLERWEIIPKFFVSTKYYSFGSTEFNHYRPLLYVTYAINKIIHGNEPWGYHVGNLLFHIGSALLVFLIIQSILAIPPSLNLPHQGGGEGTSSATFIALASALIFAVHPFNSEAVNYITARSSVMSSFFYLLAFYSWIRYRKVSANNDEITGRKKMETQSPSTFYLLPVTYYIASLLTYLLGMLTKEIVITLPAVLWLFDLYFVPVKGGNRSTWFLKHARRMLIYLPFLLFVALPYLYIRVLFWGSVMKPPKRDMLTQLYTEMPVLVKYLRLMLFPAGLNADHYVAIQRSITFPVAGSISILIVFIIIGILLFRSRNIWWRAVSFFIFWFFIVLLPTTVIPLNTILQENRGYLAGISFAFFSGLAIERMGYAFTSIWKYERRREGIHYILLLLLIITFSLLTVQRNAVWKDDLSLWSDALSKSPESPKAYINLGVSYIQRARYDKAEEILKRALYLGNLNAYDISMIHYNLGNIYKAEGKLKLAIRHYEIASRFYEGDFRARYSLALLYQEGGEYDKAIKEYKEVLKLKPDYFSAYHNVGLMYHKKGKVRLAMNFYKKALQFNPNYSKARNNLAHAYEELGEYDRAISEYMETIRRDPGYFTAYYNLGILYEKIKKYQKAVEIYRTAMSRNKDRAFVSMIDRRIKRLSKRRD